MVVLYGTVLGFGKGQRRWVEEEEKSESEGSAAS